MQSHKKQRSGTNKYSLSSILRFIIPSIIGVFLFMIPFSIDGKITIPVALLSATLQTGLGTLVPKILLTIILSSTIATILFKIAQWIKPGFKLPSVFFNSLLTVNIFWLVVRILAAVFSIFIYWGIGNEYIYSDRTGGMIFSELLPILVSVFLFAGLFYLFV